MDSRKQELDKIFTETLKYMKCEMYGHPTEYHSLLINQQVTKKIGQIRQLKKEIYAVLGL